MEAEQWHALRSSTRPPRIESFTEQDVQPGLHYLAADVANSTCSTGDTGEHYNDLFREMLVEPSLFGMMTGLEVDFAMDDLTDDTYIVLTFYGSDARSAIIERDTDNLTTDEKKKFAKELNAARTEELVRWTGFKAFHRRPRVGSQNRIDCTWVDKWKYVDGKRVIKSRL